ncbi:hypothetical protein [Nocardioides limicola]|uniref:hypothetical protein n=1 Tax=Nocardioides limicola TaxID=2803368 RepID=UPI00193C3563|nr:hypothetical protein [Nocardioides sp. DJM-14]
MHDELTERVAQLEQQVRRGRRVSKVLIGLLAAALIGFTVGPVAASHLNVTSSDLAKGAVTTPKIKKNAVTTAKIKNGAVKNAKIANGTITRNKLAPNARGAVAVATVLADGTLVASRSRGVPSSAVSLQETSAFCFTNLPFTFRTAVATPLYHPTDEGNVMTKVGLPGIGYGAGDCVPAGGLEIATEINGVWTPHAFTVAFFD